MHRRYVGQPCNRSRYGVFSGTDATLDDTVGCVCSLDNEVFQRGGGNIESGETRACRDHPAVRIDQGNMRAVVTEAGNDGFCLSVLAVGSQQQSGHSVWKRDMRNVETGKIGTQPAAEPNGNGSGRTVCICVGRSNLSACGYGQIETAADHVFHAIEAEKLRAGSIDPKHCRQVVRQHELRITLCKAFADRIQRGNIDEGV